MSVRTTADEKLDSASDHIKYAIRDLSTIVIDECWGHDEYSNEYTDVINEVLHQLLALKKKLNR
jgi:replicative superfamily II helicase